MSRMPWHVPVALSLPAWIPMLAGVARAWSAGLIATPFLQTDMPYYLANARQHFAEGFQWTYGNPYGPYGTPAVYFQPHLFMAGLWQWMGLGPETAFLLGGLLASLFAAFVAARLYEDWVGWDTPAKKLGLVCFFWGGGLISLFGCLLGATGGLPWARSVVLVDPGDGWWMLNFGRNLVFPTEAYYHGMLLLALLLLRRRRFGGTLAVAALLAISHPFTGISLSLILMTYAALELLLRSGAASRGLLAGATAITAGIVGYYLVFLGSFPDHRQVEEQWHLEWFYLALTFVPGLGLVAILAFTALRQTGWRTAFARPDTRLCLVWFAVIFALTQHELIMPPRQPLHFARGYDWMALFLLGAPALVAQLQQRLASGRKPLMAVGGLMALLLSDNFLWMATFADPAVQWQHIALTRDQRDVLDWLGRQGASRAYVASEDERISYLTATYTRLRSWVGHPFNTPGITARRQQIRRVFQESAALPVAEPVFYVPRADRAWTPPPGSKRVHANGSYAIWISTPAKDLAGLRR